LHSSELLTAPILPPTVAEAELVLRRHCSSPTSTRTTGSAPPLPDLDPHGSVAGLARRGSTD
jgi:hypothetical protein